jgi:AmmeMemoRadiSam system protein B
MEFLEALARQLGPEVFADELAHRAEHSLEFQAVYLRGHDLVSVDSGRTIVPILCQALQAYIPPGESPATSTTAQRFIEAMMTTIARSGKRVCVIAGADLAHVGPQFGDPEPLTPAALNTVHQRDLEMLRHVCAGDGEGFYAQVMEDSDARRICGLAPIYYTLAITGANQGDLRKYTQWADPSATSAISFASVIFSAGRGRTGPEPALNTEPAPPL